MIAALNRAMPMQPCEFETFRRQVYAWAYRLLGNAHDSEDVVQDVFLKWNRQVGVARPAQPRGWLRRVTLNCAMDALRKGRTVVTSSRPLILVDGESEDLAGPANREAGRAEIRLDAQHLRSDIAAALNALSDVQRSVVVAKIYEELTFAEIAEELEVAVSTVKTHYLRAVRSLSQRLHGRWAEKSSGSTGA